MKVTEILALTVIVGTYVAIRLFGQIHSLPLAPAQDLIRKFEATVFQSEYGPYEPKSVYRWESGIRLHMDGTNSSRYETFVRETLTHIRCLTGREAEYISEIEISNFPNFIVFLAPRRELAGKLANLPHSRELIERERPTGYGIAGGDGVELKAAVAAVHDDAPDSKVRNTLLEEITQGFGPINDTEIVQPSIWSDKGPDVDRLPLNDQIILRALYDPAIRPGMPKEEAMEAVRKIIPALVEAVRREGETALYQRRDCDGAQP